jgi:hypothetical protein
LFTGVFSSFFMPRVSFCSFVYHACASHRPTHTCNKVFGKDIRALLAICSQKVFFEPNHSGYYHYGPIEMSSGNTYRTDSSLDLAVGSSVGDVLPGVSRDKRGKVGSSSSLIPFASIKLTVSKSCDKSMQRPLSVAILV